MGVVGGVGDGELGEGVEGGTEGGDGASDASAVSRARGLVVDALSRTERTRGQLAQMLARKGVEPEVAEQVLDRFTEVGLIDDVGYARMFVESRHAGRGLGSRALSFELRRRGVDDEVIANAVGELDDEQQFETACRLADARLARMSGLAEPVQLRRLAGFLARKGYSGELAMRAVRLAFENRALEDESDGGSKFEGEDESDF